MSGEYLEHLTREGDRWDLLAFHYYGDALQMDVLLQANPSLLGYTLLPAGLTLRIPVLEAGEIAPGVPAEEGGLPWL